MTSLIEPKPIDPVNRVFILQEVGKTNDPRLNQQVPVYALPSGALYVIDPKKGVRYRINKDRRSPKERKRARREARASQATPESSAVS